MGYYRRSVIAALAFRCANLTSVMRLSSGLKTLPFDEDREIIIEAADFFDAGFRGYVGDLYEANQAAVICVEAMFRHATNLTYEESLNLGQILRKWAEDPDDETAIKLADYFKRIRFMANLQSQRGR